MTFDHEKLEKKLLENLFPAAIMSAEAYVAEGKITTLTMDVGSKTNVKKIENKLPANTPTTIGEVIKHYLTLRDSRLTRQKGSIGAWISPLFWSRNELQIGLNYSSAAYYEYRKRCDQVSKASRSINMH